MRILPAITQPPREPTARRHEPSPARRWFDYRRCLRWDFGFTCAFCLLHEADLHGEAGSEGLGTFTVEHWRPRSAEPELALEYRNCLWACRLCNRARSNRPIVALDGRHLLDPTQVAWSDRFERTVADELAPRAGDRDARYTWEAYDLDDARKVRRRALRRALITDRLRLVREFREQEAAVLADLALQPEAERRVDVLRALGLAWRQLQLLMGDLQRFAAIPRDAPGWCRCSAATVLELPEELDRQALDLPTE